MKVTKNDNMRAANMKDKAIAHSGKKPGTGSVVAERLSRVSNASSSSADTAITPPQTTDQPIHITNNLNLRLQDIVNRQLPENELTLQSTYTYMINSIEHKSTTYQNAEKNYADAYVNKIDLQNEGINLFNDLRQRNSTDNDNYSFYELLFSLSYSYEDIDTLLNSTDTKDCFMRYIEDETNKPQVNKLFEILKKNSAQSVDAELQYQEHDKVR